MLGLAASSLGSAEWDGAFTPRIYSSDHQALWVLPG